MKCCSPGIVVARFERSPAFVAISRPRRDSPKLAIDSRRPRTASMGCQFCQERTTEAESLAPEWRPRQCGDVIAYLWLESASHIGCAEIFNGRIEPVIRSGRGKAQRG